MKFNFIFKIKGRFPTMIRASIGVAVLLMLGILLACSPPSAGAQENYFVTYSHQMEEPGNLEIASRNAIGFPQGGHTFVGTIMELEYGVKAWWTSELYLDGQSTSGEGTVFTGFRIENRFRPLLQEHWINPVLYFEFADLNGADKSLLEVVGHDVRGDFLTRNDRREKVREAELKLILSSNFKGWNVSENLIAEKNLKAFPWEFGYAVGVSRPLSLVASPNPCRFCRENISVGAESYGGLGDRFSFGFHETSHYLGPVALLRLPSGPTFKVSPVFGLNSNSHGMLLRFGIAYEIDQFISKLRRK
jgi:hypothetical protein